MFDDMLKNKNLPSIGLFSNFTSDPKYAWTLAFIFLNVFRAAIYYATVYRYRR
jgi:hypothetical protein